MVARVWWVAALLLVSGFCALVYQVAWLREFRLVFGGSTTASAAVLAVFMGGLGLGNWLLGPKADRHPSPLRWYAQLELLIALACAVSPLLIDATRMFYTALGGQTTLGIWGATIARLIGTAVVLGVPTLLMGGTLPAAVKAVVSAHDTQRRAVGLAYGLNTLGAVAGTLASTFLLLPSLGTRTTLWTACAVNLILALVAWQLAKVLQQGPSALDRRRERKLQKRREHAESKASLVEVPQVAIDVRRIYATALVVGCGFFLMELVWFRMLTPLLGGSTFTFGLILAWVLAGIGIGGAWYPFLYRQRSPGALDLAMTCSLQALLIGVPFALGDRFALWAAEQLANRGDSFASVVAAWSFITAAMVFPAALMAGLQFPVLIGLLGQGEERVGREVGNTFAFNTLGCILGSLLGGFGLIPQLSAPGVWLVVVALLALTAAGWLWQAYHDRAPLGWLMLPALVSVGAAASLFFPGPSGLWRHTSIGAGRSKVVDRKPNEIRFAKHQLLRATLWEADGIESSLAIHGLESLALMVNGKSDGDAIGDAATQIMIGIVPAVLHEHPRTAFVVGLGTGETAGWLAAIPDIERVDCVELEPKVQEMAKLCAPVNHDVLNNPKVHLAFNDARESLTSSPATYDLIISEPSNPYRAGVANLFTREFYASVRERLNPGGIFGQWMQAYEVDAATVGIVLHTLQQEFLHVEIWQTKKNDLLLIAAAAPPSYDVAAINVKLAQQPYADALRVAWRGEGAAGLLSGYVGGPKLVAELIKAAEGRINTDDHNRLEYGFARTLGTKASIEVSEWRNDAIRLGAHRPQTIGEVDWELAVDTYLLTHVTDKVTLPFVSGLNRAQTSRWFAMNAHVRGDHRPAVALWDEQKQSPRTSTELAALTVSMLKGDERIDTFLEQLRMMEPVEADALTAMIAFRDGDFRLSAKYCERSLLSLRTDPWPVFVQHLFSLACVLAERDEKLAQPLYDALREPFAARLHDKERQSTLLFLAAKLGDDQLVAHLETYEPYVPWEEPFLTLRAETYAKTGHRLAKHAQRQLAEFRSRER